jgi:mRNA-degrading endonuclease toxin of MazEF toxin-antitoxin module
VTGSCRRTAGRAGGRLYAAGPPNSRQSAVAVSPGKRCWVEFDPVKDAAQGSLRPALNLQNDVGNHCSPTTLVATVTWTPAHGLYLFVVIIEPADSGLSQRSAISCTQIVTVPQTASAIRSCLPPGKPTVRPMGQLPTATMSGIASSRAITWASATKAKRYNRRRTPDPHLCPPLMT